MYRNSEKGFTLVELIVAIAIMGILLIIALPQVTNIQAANKDRKYEAYQSSIERASKLYIDSYSKDIFGNNESGCVLIKYSELKNKNLIKDFSGKDITCSKDDETFVQVRKIKDEYQYASSIVCRDNKRIVYQDKIDSSFPCDNKLDEGSPRVESIPKEHNWVRTENLKIKIKISDASGLNSNIGITYYFKTSAGTKVGKSYTHAYKNKKGVTSIQFQIPTSHLPKDSNQYYLVIDPYVSKTTNGVQDVLGNDVASPSTFGLYKIDNVAPKCGGVTGDSTAWTNKNKTVSVACSDDASGCTQSSFSKSFTTTIKTSNIEIRDQAGNTNSCLVNVYVDKTKPAVPTSIVRYDNSTGTIRGNSSDWTNHTLWWGEFKANTNGGSPIDHYEYSTNCTKNSSGNLNSSYTYSAETNNKVCIRAVNQAGTSSDWSSEYYFKVDKTKPTLGYALKNDVTGANYSPNTWSRNGIYRYFYPSDNASGIDVVQYDAGGGWTTENNVASCWFGEGVNNTQYRVRDKAGNYSDPIRLIIKVDWTPPTYTNIAYFSGDPWNDGTAYYVRIYFVDYVSGLGYRKVRAVDARNNELFEGNYGGVSTADDVLSTGGCWFNVEHEIYDQAGNVARWSSGHKVFC